LPDVTAAKSGRVSSSNCSRNEYINFPTDLLVAWALVVV
jgi:hypothetical protein